MQYYFRVVLFAGIGLAVVFGFAPPHAGSLVDFAPLHIFMFNLVAGGLLITTRLRDRTGFDRFGAGYLALGLVFALAAGLNRSGLIFASALVLFAMVESVRQRRFSFFPVEFFQAVPVSRKFEQASLLCLSSGLFICAGAVFGLSYLHLPLPSKLDLHIFYLGFSFPLSLIFFSLIFRRLESAPVPPSRGVAEVCFWFLNLGVIVFFFGIIFENYLGQMVMALTLFSVVLITLRHHLTRGERDRDWAHVTSGLAFLVVGSLTGIAYVGVLWAGVVYGELSRYLLGLHAAATVFGWNLTWVALSGRGENTGPSRPLVLIALHWAFVLTMPGGRSLAALAVVSGLLGFIFLDRSLLASVRSPQ